MEFYFHGTLTFGEDTYTGDFSYNAWPYTEPVLRLGTSVDGPTVAHCTVKHTPGVTDDSGLEPDGNAAPGAAVLRCTGHLSDGPPSTTTLLVTLPHASYWGRQYGSRFYYRGTYRG